MKRRQFVQSTAASALAIGITDLTFGQDNLKITSGMEATRRLLIYGSGVKEGWLRFIVGMTKKPDPKICYIPTATGDSLVSIANWYAMCEGLSLQPYVLKTFISSYSTPRSFEEVLMSMDVIIISGGNTLNMLAVWKAQGIDVILRKAYEAGILMSGGSAGSLCWFQNGTTDSRPVKVSKVEGMGWLKGSHCPHYDSEKTRRPLYHELIQKGELYPGYACDDLAGIYFENEKVVKAYALNEKSKSYHVDLTGGQIVETELPAELIR